MTSEISIIDYGMGNLHSVKSAFEYLGCNVKISSDPKFIENSRQVVLPGVGSFRKAMESIYSHRLDHAIRVAIDKQYKFLGICLGLQLCANSSSEDGESQGLCLIDGDVEPFQSEGNLKIKIPHIGFNEVKFPSESFLFRGISNYSDFYFNHSYRINTKIKIGTISTCTYGTEFLAAYEHKNIYLTQFHPEKSQTNGLKLLRNFLAG